MRNYYLNDVSLASSVFAVVTRNAIDFCHSRKGINTHVGCKFTRDRKKKKTSARAHKRREPCEIHLARLL